MTSEIVVRAQSGDREAFEALATAAYERLYGIARRILRDGNCWYTLATTSRAVAVASLSRCRRSKSIDLILQTTTRSSYNEMSWKGPS